MSKITSKDCVNAIVTAIKTPGALKHIHVTDVFSCLKPEDFASSEIKEKVLSIVTNPKNWKRKEKYSSVGHLTSHGGGLVPFGSDIKFIRAFNCQFENGIFKARVLERHDGSLYIDYFRFERLSTDYLLSLKGKKFFYSIQNKHPLWETEGCYSLVKGLTLVRFFERKWEDEELEPLFLLEDYDFEVQCELEYSTKRSVEETERLLESLGFKHHKDLDYDA